MPVVLTLTGERPRLFALLRQSKTFWSEPSSTFVHAQVRHLAMACLAVRATSDGRVSSRVNIRPLFTARRATDAREGWRSRRGSRGEGVTPR